VTNLEPQEAPQWPVLPAERIDLTRLPEPGPRCSAATTSFSSSTQHGPRPKRSARRERASSAAGSPWDKGERLARWAGADRALLVLDGLEPLQSGHAFDRGKLRDQALDTLLRGLARQSEGLCLITTREPLSDVAGLVGVTACELDQITREAGRALLRTARVVGTDAELEDVAKRFGPHALAVSPLGVYLYENDPHHRIGAARALEQLPGDEPLDRVLAGFEQWLAASAELEVLDCSASSTGRRTPAASTPCAPSRPSPASPTAWSS
jgi:hypothetical protein